MAGNREMAGVCWALVRAGLREEMQFRANFLIEVAFGLVYQTVGFAFIWVVLGRFQAIGGWTLQEVTLLYGIQLMGHALWALAFSRIILVSSMVNEGDYDTMLVRPVPIALQFMFGGFRIAVVGDVLGAVILLAAGLRAAAVDWSPAKAGFLVLAVIGSGLVRGACELAVSALSFRFLSRGWAGWLVESMFSRFGAFPLDIFEWRTRQLLTWVIPVAFVAWAPASVLLDRADTLPFPAWVAWCSPLLGVALMTLAWRFFLHESRQYQSSGS